MAFDPELADRVRAALGHEDDVTEKRMFGGLAFLVAGAMAVAANNAGALMVRVDPAGEDALLALPGVRLVEMRGRAMHGWLHVEADALDDDEALAGWVARGVAYARSLPAKR